MAQRRLALHASALSDAEYAVYTASLKDLVLGDSDAHEGQGEDDEYFARMQMGVREARAWLRGRYADVPVQTIDTILRFFSASLALGDIMSGTEFFAALRLVVHASHGTLGGGQDIDRGMAFVQADPTTQHQHTHTHISTSTPASASAPASRHGSTPSSRAQSPTKRYNPFAQAQPHLHAQGPHLARDPPPPQHPQHPSVAHANAAYTSYRRDAHVHSSSRAESMSASAAGSVHAAGSAASHPRSQGQSSTHSQTQGRSPFSITGTTVHTVPIASSSKSVSGPPQIPPRKPPSDGSAAVVPPTSTTNQNKRKSAPPVPPPRPSRADREDRDRSMSPTKTPNMNMSRSGSAVRTAPVPPAPPVVPGPSYFSLSAHPPPTLPQHVTTPLMLQSLHAAQIGQSLQRASARMEKERVMQVLRTSAGAGGGGVASGSISSFGGDVGGGNNGEGDRGRAPPLPQRRPSGRVPPPPPAQGSKPGASAVSGASREAREARGRQQLPSPPSSMGSMGSMEKVALAGDDRQRGEPERERERERQREGGSRSPTKPAPPPPPAHPQRRRDTVSSGGSPNAPYVEPATTSSPSRPPTHPDRAKKNLESFEAVYGPSLVFPALPDLEPSSEHRSVARSPFSPVSPSPPASASPSTSRFALDRDASPGRATPPGVTPRMARSRSMHHTPPEPSPPVYGTAAALAANVSPFSPFASAAPSKTAHASLAPPPPPPARRKRPESFQVLPSMAHTNSRSSRANGNSNNGYTDNTGPGGPFGLASPTSGTMNAYGVVAAAGYGSSTRDIPAGGGMGYVPSAKTGTRRKGSLGSARGESGGDRSDEDPEHNVFAALAATDAAASTGSLRPNPIAGLKQTFATANAALLPTLERAREGLDKARYKAEAGLSRRGYMRHGVGYGYAAGGGRARGEGDEGGDEAPLSDARGGGRDWEQDEEVRGAMGGLSIAREREKDRVRERQEMAGLVGGIDGHMKAPSVHYNAKKTKKERSHSKDSVDGGRDPTMQHEYSYGYGLERDWDSDEDRPSVDAGPDVDSDNEDDKRARGARPRGLSAQKDNLKWPAGEGWKPL